MPSRLRRGLPFSEFAADGELLLDVQSYRAFTYDSTAKPVDDPRVAVIANPAGGFLACPSWNGATETVGRTDRVIATPPHGYLPKMALAQPTASAAVTRAG